MKKKLNTTLYIYPQMKTTFSPLNTAGRNLKGTVSLLLFLVKDKSTEKKTATRTDTWGWELRGWTLQSNINFAISSI